MVFKHKKYPWTWVRAAAPASTPLLDHRRRHVEALATKRHAFPWASFFNTCFSEFLQAKLVLPWTLACIGFLYGMICPISTPMDRARKIIRKHERCQSILSVGYINCFSSSYTQLAHSKFWRFQLEFPFRSYIPIWRFSSKLEVGVCV